jgi:hypothetical protein
VKQINIFVKNPSVTLQLFDKWVAYRQSLSPDYKSDIDITFEKNYQPGCLNIWFDTMPDSIDDRSLEFDVIFLCNTGEPTSVSTPSICQMSTLDKVYLCADGYVSKNHILYDKIVWHPHDPLKCNNYFFRPFYPQFYTLNNRQNKHHKKGMAGINGSNRTWRHYFWNLLKTKIPDFPVRNNFSNVSKTTDSFWESEHDTIFRDFVNNLYNNDNSSSNRQYYDDSIAIGINQKFGKIPPGYFFLDMYFEKQCIIFPETTWQNNELCLTEKGLKCFSTRTLPFPIGGSNINHLYNELGFYTAWNLLPVEHQMYDTIEDHQQRYLAQINAISWLWDNQAVLETNLAKDLIEKNFINCLSNVVDYKVIDKFDRWMIENFL